MNTRRNLLIALNAALFTPGAVFGQAKKPLVVIGWLNTGSRETDARTLVAFKEGMGALGWKEGANFALEERWASGRVDRLTSLAQELKARKPALIVAANTSAVIAAAKASPDIPIVQANGAALLTVGLAKSLARPGGMVTGVTNIAADLSEKYLELLLTAAPKLKRVGFLVDSTTPISGDSMKAARRAAEHYRVDARFAEVAKTEELEPALSRLAKEGVQGLVALPSWWMSAERARIVKLALAHRWPMIAVASMSVEEGALLSYGVDRLALYHRAAYYVDRILKGTKPADLPIEQPMRFDLVVNLKTAKALGLTMPPEIMVQATRVIQ